MQLTPAEAFVLVRTAASQLRDVGVGVVLPPSLSGGLASRLGLAITAELPEKSRGFTLGESLVWHWEFMIGGVTLTLRDLERLQTKRSPLVQHKGAWIELRPSDLRNAERFCNTDPGLSLDDALRLTATDGDMPSPPGRGCRRCWSNTTSRRPPIRCRRPPASPASCAPIRSAAWAGWPSCTALIRAPAWPTTWAWARRSSCWPSCSTSRPKRN
jgi:hypothetical protein